jgi:hypothetical protein
VNSKIVITLRADITIHLRAEKVGQGYVRMLSGDYFTDLHFLLVNHIRSATVSRQDYDCPLSQAF